MKAIPFNGANVTLRGNGDNVRDMVVYSDGLVCVSVWELSDQEMAELLRTRKLYLTVFHPPSNFPPVGLSTEDPLPSPFIFNPNKRP